jgi:hypothetical protein
MVLYKKKIKKYASDKLIKSKRQKKKYTTKKLNDNRKLMRNH